MLSHNLPRAFRRNAFLAMLLLAFGPIAMIQAAPVVLSEANSVLTLDTQLPTGINSWSIDGTSHLSQLWFWYRVGATGPEASIDTLQHDPLFDLQVLDTNFEAGLDTMIARYTSPGLFELTLKVSLTAGSPGSLSANLIEQVAVKNISGAALPFNLFQLAHFSLNGAITPDTVEILGGNTATQSNSTLWMIAEAESIALPMPAQYQVGSASSLLGSLNDGTATTLTGYAGPETGPDTAFALQWSQSIPAGGTMLVSSAQNIVVAVPEPSTVVLLGLGGLFAGVIGIRGCRRSS